MARLTNVHKTYTMSAGNVVQALRGVTLDIPRGAFYALMGPSGSGKSTLLNIIGSLDRPDTGTITLDGTDITAISPSELPDIRRRLIGFVFQGFNLIPTLNALENVALPLKYEGIRRRKAREHAVELLEKMGLGGRIHHRPNELSGGEQQRVAISRALIMNPPLILADEPTGEVDTATSETIMSLLSDLNEKGQTIVVVTHDPFTASYAERVIRMRDGHILSPDEENGE
ncbi:MAG: ABC transporter ATP-binding protein [Actinobacteria bacterium]|nr:ABC transporter ATP-binding protein [Actinomycetota bacterium]